MTEIDQGLLNPSCPFRSAGLPDPALWAGLQTLILTTAYLEASAVLCRLEPPEEISQQGCRLKRGEKMANENTKKKKKFKRTHKLYYFSTHLGVNYVSQCY
jgi:hypothetical protein